MGQQFLDFEGTKIIANKIKETDNKIEALKTSQSLEYEGENITCENTLISRTSDMLIKGQTYQNLLKRVNFNQTTTEEGNDYIFTGVETGYSTFHIYPSLNLQSNKKYTIILNAKNLTLTDNYVFTLDYFNDSKWLYGNEIRTTGVHKFVVQTTSDITSMRLQIRKGENCNLTFSKDIIILEGDWTDKEVPTSITGIESVGERENKISILSKNNNSEDDDNYKQDKKEILLPVEGGLKRLPNDVYDTIEERNDGVYLVQRVKKEAYADGDENNNNYLTDKVNTYKPLETPIETKLSINSLDLEVYEGTTYITTDNAIQPVLNLKITTNIGGIIQENTQNINKLYKLIDELIIPQLINNSADIEILKLK